MSRQVKQYAVKMLLIEAITLLANIFGPTFKAHYQVSPNMQHMEIICHLFQLTKIV